METWLWKNSRELCNSGSIETWTPNPKKHSYEHSQNHPMLHRVYIDFKDTKRIVEGYKRGTWNNSLPLGFSSQDITARFGTVFIVIERFLKTVSIYLVLMMNQRHVTASKYYFALENEVDHSGSYKFSCACSHFIRVRWDLPHRNSIRSISESHHSFRATRCSETKQVAYIVEVLRIDLGQSFWRSFRHGNIPKETRL